MILKLQKKSSKIGKYKIKYLVLLWFYFKKCELKCQLTFIWHVNLHVKLARINCLRSINWVRISAAFIVVFFNSRGSVLGKFLFDFKKMIWSRHFTLQIIFSFQKDEFLSYKLYTPYKYYKKSNYYWYY